MPASPLVCAPGEASAERSDERLVSLGRFGLCRLCRRLGQGWRRHQPETNEYRQALDGDADITLYPRHAAVDLVESLGDDRLAALSIIRRHEGCDGSLGDHGLRPIPACGEVGQRRSEVWIEIDRDL